MNGRYSGPADPSTPCDWCGGPTYTFVSGSIWCPFEDHTPERGTHWVKQVFFEREPKSLAEARERTKAKPIKSRKPITPHEALAKAAPGQVAEPLLDPFGGGIDDFVKSDR